MCKKNLLRPLKQHKIILDGWEFASGLRHDFDRAEGDKEEQKYRRNFNGWGNSLPLRIHLIPSAREEKQKFAVKWDFDVDSKMCCCCWWQLNAAKKSQKFNMCHIDTIFRWKIYIFYARPCVRPSKRFCKQIYKSFIIGAKKEKFVYVNITLSYRLNSTAQCWTATICCCQSDFFIFTRSRPAASWSQTPTLF